MRANAGRFEFLRRGGHADYYLVGISVVRQLGDYPSVASPQNYGHIAQGEVLWYLYYEVP